MASTVVPSLSAASRTLTRIAELSADGGPVFCDPDSYACPDYESRKAFCKHRVAATIWEARENVRGWRLRRLSACCAFLIKRNDTRSTLSINRVDRGD
jgi:hypothetical protein